MARSWLLNEDGRAGDLFELCSAASVEDNAGLNVGSKRLLCVSQFVELQVVFVGGTGLVGVEWRLSTAIGQPRRRRDRRLLRLVDHGRLDGNALQRSIITSVVTERQDILKVIVDLLRQVKPIVLSRFVERAVKQVCKAGLHVGMLERQHACGPHLNVVTTQVVVNISARRLGCLIWKNR